MLLDVMEVPPPTINKQAAREVTFVGMSPHKRPTPII